MRYQTFSTTHAAKIARQLILLGQAFTVEYAVEDKPGPVMDILEETADALLGEWLRDEGIRIDPVR